MTKKDYVAIAKILYNDHYRTEEMNDFIKELCILFRQDNPNFNKDKFLEACGL